MFSFQVAQRKDSNLVISCRPFMQLVLPEEQKRIEVLLETVPNDSGKHWIVRTHMFNESFMNAIKALPLTLPRTL